MAKRFTIELLMDLAKSIGANPNKFMGTKNNITFLGTGPNKNPLFQRPLPGLERAGVNQLGSRDALIEATEDAMSYATSGKLNTIQTEILGKNLTGIKNIIEPPPLPMATITKFPKQDSGITSVRTSSEVPTFKVSNEQFKKQIADDLGSTLPKPGPGELQAFQTGLDAKTGMSRAIARELLLKDTRLNLPDDVLKSLRTGERGADPLDLMRRYYGESMLKYDDFLNSVNVESAAPSEFAEMILKNVKLTPQFAEGGLADIMQTPRRGYAQGIGPVGEGKSFPTNSKMPQIDPYRFFFQHQNKLMFDDEMKRRGLARLLEV